MKQDQMSMSASIEAACRFWITTSWSWPPPAAGSQAARLLHKRILRDAVRDVVPRAILERPKMGFPVPFGGWLQDGWDGVAREVLLDRRARERDLVRPQAVDQLLSRAARASTGPPTRSGRSSTSNWHRTFIDGEGIQNLPARRGAAAASGSRAPSSDARRRLIVRILWLNANLLLPSTRAASCAPGT
ncbi:MAG: asparagine synthase-related protein [Vicinamibacterales bacterium]